MHQGRGRAHRQNPEIDGLSNEVIGTMVTAAIHPSGADPGGHTVGGLQQRWSRSGEGSVKANVAQLKRWGPAQRPVLRK